MNQNPVASTSTTIQLYARRRARLISTLLLGFFPVVVVILLIWNLINPNFDWARILTGAIIVVYWASYRLSRSQYYRAGVLLLIGLVFAAVLVVMSKAPRPYVERLPSLSFLSVAVLLASVLLSIRATVITLSIGMSGIVLLLTVNEIPIALTFVYLIFMFCIAILSIVSAYVQRTVLIELDHQKNELIEREALFRELAEHSPDMILFVEPFNNKLRYANRPDFVGYQTSDPLFLQVIRDNTHPDDLPRVDSYWQKFEKPVAANEQHGVEYRLRSKSGQWEWIHTRKAVISRSADGRLEKVLITASVITRRKDEAQRQMDVTIEHERLRILNSFIRDASHEFRTPLSTIVTNLYMLEQHQQSEEDQKLIKGIEQQSFSIMALVDAMTLLVQLSSNITLELEIYPINAIFEESKVRTHPTIVNNNHTLLTDLSNPSPTVLADRNLLAQAFIQLIDNAAQNTDNGGTITVRTYFRDDMVALEVQDTGLGIADEALPHIFDTFFRADSVHSTAGFGLGLSMVKRIVERLRGTVEVETKVGIGSTFRLIFPSYSEIKFASTINSTDD